MTEQVNVKRVTEITLSNLLIVHKKVNREIITMTNLSEK